MKEGLLEQAEGRWRLRFTRRLAHPPEKVWRALTEPEHLAAWFPTTIEGDRAEGAKLRFNFRDGEAPGFDGELLTYRPPELLEFAWGPDLLRLELRPDGDGTELTLLDTLEELGKAARDAAGWHVCLDRLGAHLNGAEARPESEWVTVYSEYVDHFGPEASTIGPPEGR
jgi:uncharacterized protein YndB with AHSA1/START domain